LYQTTARGLPSGQENRFGAGRYYRSFWSVPYRTATGCDFQIPYMMGAGGNLVVLLPNGNNFGVDTMVLAGEALRPFPCPAGVAAPPVPAPVPLTARALRIEVPEHTFYGAPQNFFPVVFGARLTMFVAADGGLYGFQEGETFTFLPQDRFGKGLSRRVPGNPESF
jgi:hypothetical protein